MAGSHGRRGAVGEVIESEKLRVESASSWLVNSVEYVRSPNSLMASKEGE